MRKRRRGLPRGWYPVDGRECKGEIESYLDGWSVPGFVPGQGVGGIVPHAGWYFSGKLASRVFASLRSDRKIDAIVLYGGHMGPGDVPRVVAEDACETPLGDIEIDRDFLNLLAEKVEVQKESPSGGDNTIEIQLTLIKYFFPGAKILAIRPPFSRKALELGREIARIGKDLGRFVLAIGSTDLTHYGPNYGFVPEGIGRSAVDWVRRVNDRFFIEKALEMDGEGVLEHALRNDSACSAGAVASAIATCEALGAKRGVLLDYYTSYDVMPDDSFVGYAGLLF